MTSTRRNNLGELLGPADPTDTRSYHEKATVRGVTVAPTLASVEAAVTGRRRCRIPGHRQQIRAMQKWQQYLEARHQNDIQRKRRDTVLIMELRGEVVQAQRTRMPHTYVRATWFSYGFMAWLGLALLTMVLARWSR